MAHQTCVVASPTHVTRRVVCQACLRIRPGRSRLLQSTWRPRVLTSGQTAGVVEARVRLRDLLRRSGERTSACWTPSCACATGAGSATPRLRTSRRSVQTMPGVEQPAVQTSDAFVLLFSVSSSLRMCSRGCTPRAVRVGLLGFWGATGVVAWARCGGTGFPVTSAPPRYVASAKALSRYRRARRLGCSRLSVRRRGDVRKHLRKGARVSSVVLSRLHRVTASVVASLRRRRRRLRPMLVRALPGMQTMAPRAATRDGPIAEQFATLSGCALRRASALLTAPVVRATLLS